MRLSSTEITTINRVIESYMVNGNFEIRLFGSRVSDKLKGGDIDLLLICQDQSTAKQAAMHKIDILVDLKQLIGDQKIDLVIALDSDLLVDPFLKLIYPTSKVLPKTSDAGI